MCIDSVVVNLRLSAMRYMRYSGGNGESETETP